MRVLVTGGSGFIGSAVVAELRASGHQVVGNARSDASAARLRDAGAEVVRAGLEDAEVLQDVAAGSDGVIHLAYVNRPTPVAGAERDEATVAAFGDALAGSGKPLVIASGTLGLPPDADERTPFDASAGLRARAGIAALALADRGVRSVVVRLAPCVHDAVVRGFTGQLVDSARRARSSGYLGDGANRWPAAHRLDIAPLFRLAVERAEPGVLHGAGERGVPLRDIAARIADRLGVPLAPVAAEEAADRFGWLAPLVGMDGPVSTELTRRSLGWEPVHRGLLAEIDGWPL